MKLNCRDINLTENGTCDVCRSEGVILSGFSAGGKWSVLLKLKWISINTNFLMDIILFTNKHY